jgi:flavodoxin
MDDNTDNPDNNDVTVTHRANKIEMQRYITRVIQLLQDNKTTREIAQILMKELNKSRAQVSVYIRKATEIMTEDFQRDVIVRTIEIEQGLRSDLSKAYSVFNSLENGSNAQAVWYKLILETKDRLQKLIPEVKDDNNQAINISYKVVDSE